jgi:gas vesicle protein
LFTTRGAAILKASGVQFNYKEFCNMDDSRGLSYFFLGLGVGVAVGILFAPQSGEETRGLIKSKAQEGGEYVKRRTGDLRESASDIVDRGRTVVNKQKEQLSAAIDAGKQAYREAVSGTDAPAPEGV